MELPQRKKNRLNGYDYGRSGKYFITVCTSNRICYLGDIITDDKNKNCKTALSDYGEIADNYIKYIDGYECVAVDNYVIMPNHIHLILTIKNVGDGALDVPKNKNNDVQMNINNDVLKNNTNDIPKTGKRQNETIPKIVSVFKRLVNKETGRDIWQRSYYDRIIRNEKEYEKINDYINHNPETWANDILNDNIIHL